MTATASVTKPGNEPAGTGHHLPLSVKQRQHRMAVLLLLGSDVVFFICLLFAFFYLKTLNENNMWLPKGLQVPPASQGFILAGILILSSLAYRWGDKGIRKGNQSQLKAGIGIALGLWIVELFYQISLWSQLSMHPGQGGFASMFYVISGYHTFHLLLGLFLGVGLFNRILKGRYMLGDSVDIEIVGYLWYWITMMAIIVAILPS